MGYAVKDLAASDRPREKLVRVGASALGDNELVAVVLGSGTRRQGALALAQDVLTAVGGTEGLAGATVADLARVRGIGASKAARLVAAVEIGRRAIVRPVGERPRFASAGDMARYLVSMYGGFRLERFGVMLFDVKHRLIRTAIVSVGELDSSAAPPREIFREALLASASGVVLFHNHPSGDALPSAADIALTDRLIQSADTLGLAVLDHIILGRDGYFSFQEAGKLP